MYPDATDPQEGSLAISSSQTMNSLKLVNSQSRELQNSVSKSDLATQYKAQASLDSSTDTAERYDAPPRVTSTGRTNGFSSSPSPQSERSVITKSYTNSTLTPNTSIQSVRTISSEFDRQQVIHNSEDATSNPDNPQWSSAIGKASLGKTGRVLEKLVGENDMLKRELNLEKLKSEENRNAVKMVEARMDAQTNDYESRLHDAAVTKTLLKRRERQVIELKEQVDVEKTRAETAVDNAKMWREAMEQMQIDCQEKIAEATNKTMLFEGSYNTLQGHWKDKEAAYSAMVARHRAEIKAHREQIIKKGEAYQKLHDMCDQLSHDREELQTDNARLKQAQVKYKETQEAALASIKGNAAHQEMLYESKLKEAMEVIGEMRWVMNVKRDLRPDSGTGDQRS